MSDTEYLTILESQNAQLQERLMRYENCVHLVFRYMKSATQKKELLKLYVQIRFKEGTNMFGSEVDDVQISVAVKKDTCWEISNGSGSWMYSVDLGIPIKDLAAMMVEKSGYKDIPYEFNG